MSQQIRRLINVLLAAMWVGQGMLAAEIQMQGRILDVHGFISQGYLRSDGNNFFANTTDGTFQFNEIGINFATDLTDRLHTGLQFFSRDLGELGNNRLVIDWAYADYRWRDWLGLRIGKIKTPYGLYNETRDLDLVRTSIFLPQSIYPESQRETFLALQGVGLYGYAPLGRMGEMGYQIIYGESDIETDGSMARFMEAQAQAALTNVDASTVVNAALEWQSPIEGLRLSASLLMLDLALRYRVTEQTSWALDWMPVGSEFPYALNNMRGLMVSLEYLRGAFTLSAEYERFLTDVTSADTTEHEQDQEGYYVGAAYRLKPWCELDVYYAVIYPDRDDREGRLVDPDYLAWQKDFTVTARFDLNDFWTLKLEGHIVNGASLFFPQDNPDGFQQESALFVVKATYNF